jgi:hypothetical protein
VVIGGDTLEAGCETSYVNPLLLQESSSSSSSSLPFGNGGYARSLVQAKPVGATLRSLGALGAMGG